MASATSSGVCKLRTRRALQRALEVAVRDRAVPLLVLGLPEFAQTAWHRGTAAARALERRTALAFVACARRLVRSGDALAHDWGSDTFLVAMLDGAREGRPPSVVDCRIMLERFVAGVATQCGRRLESGWWAIDASMVHDLDGAVARALERGRRERSRYEFLAAVGHELRTPLASIRGYLETVLDGDVDPQSTRRFLDTARRETLRLGRMVDGMLEFSLLDLSPPSLVVHVCDVGERIAAAIETIAPLARAREVTVASSTPERVLASIEPDACTHALLNLLDNAVRYASERGSVRIECRAGDTIAEISIEDDGLGIDGRIHGHGLGLRIARTIAERAGGRVTLSRMQHGGTRALLALPRYVEAERRSGPS